MLQGWYSAMRCQVEGREPTFSRVTSHVVNYHNYSRAFYLAFDMVGGGVRTCRDFPVRGKIIWPGSLASVSLLRLKIIDWYTSNRACQNFNQQKKHRPPAIAQGQPYLSWRAETSQPSANAPGPKEGQAMASPSFQTFTAVYGHDTAAAFGGPLL